MAQDSPPDIAELVVVMAHDLKNPLAALMTNLHFLQGAFSNSNPDPDAVDALGDSLMLCEVLERFLRNLDLFARAGDIVARRQIISVGALAQEAVNRARGQASTASVELVMETDGYGDPTALVDRDLFARALENVIANAVEHAPSGSTVRVEIAAEDAETAVVVTDARATPPALQTIEGIAGGRSPAGSTSGKRLQGLYGRGLALLSADLAARATGARVEIAGIAGACRLRLVAPARE